MNATEPDAPPTEPTPPTEPVEPIAAPVTDEAGPARPRRWPLTVALVAVALLGGVAGAVTTNALDDDNPAVVAAASGPSVRLRGGTLDVAGVVAKAGPSVVSISVANGAGRGAGTGVILTAAGEILTNAHVVDGASTVRVTLAGASQAREATVVGVDESADLALLRVGDASGLRAADLGNSADVKVGDDVVAIGNALALRGGPTVTRGIVSGLDRSLDTVAGTITGLIQTDASISSGNSGGPLVNAAGEVIGINTAVASSGRASAVENIGFAIAIDQAMPVVERLRSGQPAAAAGYLGIRTADPADGSRGARVVDLEDGSPAAAAGLEVGDLITHVGDKAVDGAAALTSAIRAHAPGERVEVRIVRDGDEQTLTVTLGTRPAS